MSTAAEAGGVGTLQEAPTGWWAKLSDQFGFRQMVSDYLIPVETNSIWYLLGGVLAIALALEILTGFLLSLVYVPDAGLAYQNVAHLLQTVGWATIVSFHYYNSYLIFGLVMIHMVRVFITGGYRRGKEGLWLVGVGLAGLTFVISITGEALHWDEVGFAVPWHVSEVFQAFGVASAMTRSRISRISRSRPKSCRSSSPSMSRSSPSAWASSSAGITCSSGSRGSRHRSGSG
ncbi:MAG TPA: cytochrome b N-terminal domain-containing protein [Candidatus Limnocylindrales bacterium]|jgi:quinol-cytochrome oxidoreductase complex cytochrome b subunit